MLLSLHVSIYATVQNYDVTSCLSISPDREEVIDFTTAVLEEPIGIYFAIDATRKGYFIYTFSYQLWLLVLSLLVLVCGLLSVASKPCAGWKLIQHNFFMLLGNLLAQG